MGGNLLQAHPENCRAFLKCFLLIWSVCPHDSTDQHDDDYYNCEGDDTGGIPGNRDRGWRGCWREFRFISYLVAGIGCRRGRSCPGSLRDMQNSRQEGHCNQKKTKNNERTRGVGKFHVPAKYNRNLPSRGS